MKKVFALLLSALLLVLGVIVLGSCDGGEEVTVTYDSAGGTYIYPVTAVTGKTITAPREPKLDGYTFAGWYNGDTLWSFSKNKVASDMTLTAKWTVATYTITYVVGEGENSQENKLTFKKDELPVSLGEATHPSLNFVGWELDGQRVNKITTTGNKTLTAVFAGVTESLTYEEYDDGYIVTGCNAEETDICIPEKYLDKPVLGIKAGAFKNNEKIFSLTASSALKIIGKEAFRGCENLLYVDLGGVETIEDYVFFGCEGLIEVVIPETVTYIGQRVFMNAINLEKINLPDGIKYIGEDFIFNCEKIQYETVSGGKYIDNWLIEYIDAEERTPTFKEGIVGIYSYAFYTHGKIRVVTIPDTVKYIGSQAFFNCYYISVLHLSQNLEYIGMYAFNNCIKIKTVTLSKTVTDIGYKAFGSCRELTINCMLDEAPAGYANGWNDERPVVYSYVGE